MLNGRYNILKTVRRATIMAICAQCKTARAASHIGVTPEELDAYLQKEGYTQQEVQGAYEHDLAVIAHLFGFQKIQLENKRMKDLLARSKKELISAYAKLAKYESESVIVPSEDIPKVRPGPQHQERSAPTPEEIQSLKELIRSERTGPDETDGRGPRHKGSNLSAFEGNFEDGDESARIPIKDSEMLARFVSAIAASVTGEVEKAAMRLKGKLTEESLTDDFGAMMERARSFWRDADVVADAVLPIIAKLREVT